MALRCLNQGSLGAVLPGGPERSPAGRKAVDWALGDAKDLRQLALVFDWCGPMMTKLQTDRLAEKIQRLISDPMTSGQGPDARRERDKVFGAIAIADQLPDHGDTVLAGVVNDWWRGKIVKRIATGAPAIARDQVYALYEMMHAIRDNLKVDLRESVAGIFPFAAHRSSMRPLPEPFSGSGK